MLNHQQQQAVEHPDGHVLVHAGPGSGKTRTLTHRAAQLVKRGVEPRRILLVTFTNKAATEMTERLGKLVKEQDAKRIWSFTFHRACVRLLRGKVMDLFRAGRTSKFTIASQDDQESIVRKLVLEIGRDWDRQNDRDPFKPANVRNWISVNKSNGKTPENVVRESEVDEGRATIWVRYENELVRLNAYDFDDLLLRVKEAITSSGETATVLRERFDHVLVDEYQDTSPVQHELVTGFADGGNLFAVGDPRQSIYGFRGAKPQNIDELIEQFRPTAIELTTCYRCSQPIVDCFNALIMFDPYGSRLSPMTTPNHHGSPVSVVKCGDNYDEAKIVRIGVEQAVQEGLDYRQLAVLYRSHHQSQAIENKLVQRGIPYQVVRSVGFWDRTEVKDVLAYLRLARNPDDDDALRRVINKPARRLGDKFMKELSVATRHTGRSLWASLPLMIERCRKDKRKSVQQFVYLIEHGRALVASGQITSVIRYLANSSGYARMLQEQARKVEQEGDSKAYEKALSRVQCVGEMMGAADHYISRSEQPTLDGFLDEVALMSDQDHKKDRNAVKLMTIHACKGLEFRRVWLVGFEKQLLPHVRCGNETERQEERRMAYVAISRAEERLAISWCRFRHMYGREIDCDVSPFLEELLQGLKQMGRSDSLVS
jgi:DNA helicase-2/ATP-dependent DNA helicase PcrA